MLVLGARWGERDAMGLLYLPSTVMVDRLRSKSRKVMAVLLGSMSPAGLTRSTRGSMGLGRRLTWVSPPRRRLRPDCRRHSAVRESPEATAPSLMVPFVGKYRSRKNDAHAVGVPGFEWRECDPIFYFRAST